MITITEQTVLVIPDIHLRFQKAQKIIDRHPSVNRIVLLGDYFDNFGDTPEQNAKCANWLATLRRKDPRVVLLMGNHDAPYLQPRVTMFRQCPGYEETKELAIGDVLLSGWVRNVHLACEANGWLLSHAGLNPYYVMKPLPWLESIKQAEQALWNGVWNPLFYFGSRMTGVTTPPGGIFWQDWEDEFRPIPGLPQIVGHTRDSYHRIFEDGYSGFGVCLDTNSHTHGVIATNGDLSIFSSDNFALIETIPQERAFA